MEDFNNLIRAKSDYKKQREDKYKVDSRDRLSKIVKKKIQTTMIGALSSIEEHFGFLWTNDQGDLTQEQIFMRDTYQKVRSEILDKGNTQSRNIDAELSQYEVEWNRYTMSLPVLKEGEE